MAKLGFTKMHGIGNDYVYVDCFRERCRPTRAALARAHQRPALRHRRRRPDPDLPVRTAPTPACGCSTPTAAEAEMCGNGVRCVAKYVYDHGIARKNRARRSRPAAAS